MPVVQQTILSHFARRLQFRDRLFDLAERQGRVGTARERLVHHIVGTEVDLDASASGVTVEALRAVGTLCSARAILPPMGIIEAEFDDGVLRPVRRLPLRPGERVGIVVVRRPDVTRWDLARLSKAASADEERLAEAGLSAWADALDREDRR